MRRPTALLAALLLVGAFAGAVAAPAAASPRPVSVCEVCTDRLESTADRHGVDLTVGTSTVRAEVAPDGDVRWTARVELNPTAADRLAANDTLRATVLDELYLAPDATDTASTVEGRTLVVRYRTPDAASRGPLSTLRFEGLRDDPGAHVYTGLGADRLTVVGPEGTTVAHAPPGATVADRRVTVRELPDGDGPFVVFAPDGAPLSGVAGFAAVVAAVWGYVARNVLLFLVVPGAVVSGGLWGAAGAVRRLDRTAPDAAAVGGGLLAVGGVVVFAHPIDAVPVPVVSGFDPTAAAAGVAAVLVGGALAAAPRLAPERRLPVLLAAALAVPIVAAVVLPAYHGAVTPDRYDLRNPGTRALAVVPLALAPAVGHAVRRGRRTASRVRLLAVAVALLVLAGTFGVVDRGGTLYGLAVVLAVGYALLVTALGVPLALLGGSVDAK